MIKLLFATKGVLITKKGEIVFTISPFFNLF